MRKFAALAVFAACIGVPSICPGPVSADADIPIVRPIEVLNQLMQPAPYNGYGAYFDATTTWAVSSLTFSPYPVPVNGVQDQTVWDWSLCTSLDDPSCSPGTNNFLTATSMLGTCIDDSEIGCIESVTVKVGDGSTEQLTKVKAIGPDTVFPAKNSMSVPRASSASLWQSPSNGRFVVSSFVRTSYLSSSGVWNSQSPSFQFQIERISASEDPTPGYVQVDPGFTSGKHIITGNGVGFTPLKFLDKTSFTAKIRLPNTIKGWFQARLKNGVVGSISQSSSSTVYEVSGETAPVIVAGGAVPAERVPPGYFSATYPSFTLSTGGVLGPIDPGNGSRSLIEYAAWSPLFGDKALTSIREWNIKSSGWPVQNACFTNLTGVTGLLATNAAAYEGSPPAWDAENGSLAYKVAAPHNDENGQENVGSYTLSLPAAAARCLYGSSELPAKVEISVGYNDAGADLVSTSVLSENKGWLNFSTFGFHYSSPSIRLKFGRPAVAEPSISGGTTPVTVTAPTTTLPMTIAPISAPIQPVVSKSLLSSASGTAVPIRRAPASSIATDSAVAVGGQKVSVALRAPVASGAKDPVVRYALTLKALTKGARTLVKSTTARSGAVSTIVVSGSRKSRYQVLLTALTKSGKSLKWTGPTLTTS